MLLVPCETGRRRRPSAGLLGGLWEFPEWEHATDPTRATALDEVDHVFSHFRATYRPFVTETLGVEVAAGLPPSALGPEGADPEEPRWLTLSEIEALPLPVAQRKIAVQVAEWLRAQRGRE